MIGAICKYHFSETAGEKTVLPDGNQSKKYVDLYNASNKDTKIVSYHFQPLKGMEFHAYKVNFTHLILRI